MKNQTAATDGKNFKTNKDRLKERVEGCPSCKEARMKKDHIPGEPIKLERLETIHKGGNKVKPKNIGLTKEEINKNAREERAERKKRFPF